MARYYTVSPRFWAEARRAGWDDQTKNLALYFLTCTHRNLEGLYSLPKAYVAADLGWTSKVVDDTLDTLEADGFVQYDEQAEVVFVVKALKYHAPKSEKQIQGAIASLEALPATPLFMGFQASADTHSEGFAEELRDWLESHPELTRAGAVPEPTPTPKPSLVESTSRFNGAQDRLQRGAVQQVFDAWIAATGKTAATKLDDKRRRIITRALKSHGLDDCLDAVRGWRHSPHHRGENDTGTVYNDLELLLRDAARIEKFRDLERQTAAGNGRGITSTLVSD